MAALEAGVQAPEFAWPGIDGKAYSLKDALAGGPMLLGFFKVSCPVCQFTFPFLERFARHFGRVWGVSQDGGRDSKAFAKEYGLAFPILLEDTDHYPTSNAYGLTHVPTVFLISASGEVLFSMVGWSKRDIQEMAAKMTELTGKPGFAPFQPGEDVPAMKGG